MSKNESSNVLVWLDQGPYSYLHFGIAKSLSIYKNFDFYGIVTTRQDIDFFKTQNILKFKKTFYFPECYIGKSSYNLESLKNFESRFDLNLWLDVYGERFFHKHRTNFHKFSKAEILVIIENSILFFSKLLEEIQPKLIIMQTAGENIANTLLFKIAKKLRIKVLMVNPTHIHNRVVVSDNLTSDEISRSFNELLPKFGNKLKEYDVDFIKNKSLAETVKVQQTFNFDNATKSQKLSHYFERINNDPEPIYQNLGKTKSKMIKSKFTSNIETKKRKSFLDKNAITEIEDSDFLYFPLHTEPEAKILATAPFYSNQKTVIENIARSIPVDFVLYVKEHPGQELKQWHSIDYYEKILELPNVKLVHPSVNSQKLISKCSCVISITGSTGFESLFYKKPVILFANEYYDCLSMVSKVNNLTELPTLISKTLSSYEFNNKEMNVLISSTYSETIDVPYFQMMSDALKISSMQRLEKNPELTSEQFSNFFKNYSSYFDVLANEIFNKLNE